MHAGAQIINIASVAACQPVPYIGIYAASKAFVLSYSRSFNRELDDKDISVMAVCPFWTKIEFFDHAVVNEEKACRQKNMPPCMSRSRSWQERGATRSARAGCKANTASSRGSRWRS